MSNGHANQNLTYNENNIPAPLKAVTSGKRL